VDEPLILDAVETHLFQRVKKARTRKKKRLAQTGSGTTVDITYLGGKKGEVGHRARSLMRKYGKVNERGIGSMSGGQWAC